jgi:hypothetical protein
MREDLTPVKAAQKFTIGLLLNHPLLKITKMNSTIFVGSLA